MKSCRFIYSSLPPELQSRQLMGKPAASFLEQELSRFKVTPSPVWDIQLGGHLLFNYPALVILANAVREYRGNADQLNFLLQIDSATFDQYYSLQPDYLWQKTSPNSLLRLPIVAKRTRPLPAGPGSSEDLTVELEARQSQLGFPAGLCDDYPHSLPRCLLLPVSHPFDFLFANQIAVLNLLEEKTRHSPRAWLKAIFGKYPSDRSRRAISGFRSIHPSAEIHPSAVIEGSIVEAGARIGAHSVVRYSYIGKAARLHDGAKVEFSVVGEGSWLMHDLVLYRCYVEREVFLIHGPYQFSGFQNRSAAFATIMMDYRPDGKPIRVATSSGIKEYRGRFLGNILQEGAKTLGGSLVAPGVIVPSDTWLSAEGSSIHRQPTPTSAKSRPLSPQSFGPFKQPELRERQL